MRNFEPSDRMKRIDVPPIAHIMARVRQMRSEGRKVFSMAQAVPWYAPPENAIRSLSQRLYDTGLHGYGPDPGLGSSRRAVADDLSQRRGIDLDWEGQLHLTCGASQAFLGALLACTEVGDSVMVIEPYYFDHVFAIHFSGMELVSIPMETTEDRWGVPKEAIEENLDRVAAVVLVNPGNPTGSALSQPELRWLREATRDSGTFLIIDETYERFNFEGANYAPADKNGDPHVMVFGSFSKSLGMAGWRLGYLFGPAALMEQALKVQDSVVICPPTPAQHLLEEALKEQQWIDGMVEGVLKRLHACRKAMDRSPGLDWRAAEGGFFTLAKANTGLYSLDACLDLLERYGIATIPGSAFGPTGEGHLRVSFGCLSDDELEDAMETLAGVEF